MSPASSPPAGSAPSPDYPDTAVGGQLARASRELMARNLRWLMIVRGTFLASTGLLALLVVLSVSAPIPATLPLLGFAISGLAVTVFHVVLRASGTVGLVAQAYLQFAWDLVLVTGLVYATGGANSSFSMLYLMVIAAAAVILRRRAGITVAEVAWLLYATTVVSLYLGWFSTDPSSEAGATSVGRLAYALFVHLVGFYGVALLTSLLSNQAARAERQLAAAAGDLEDLEIFHRDVVESMSSGLVLVDLQDRVIDINRTGRTILGLDEVEERADLSDLGLLDAEHWQRMKLEAGTDRIRDEVTIPASDDSVRTVGFSVGVIRTAEGGKRGHSIVFQELTEWRQLQNELNVKERMAAVGELAAGLAHEIGNPLAAISGSVQMLRGSASEDPPATAEEKLLDIVLKESQRLDRTIKSFLRFAKPHERNDQRFDIGELINENVELLRNSSEVLASHQLVVDLDPPSVFVVADRDQIVQVFWNLARNALRAMPQGGTFTVEGRVLDRDGEPIYSLRFEDSGKGMTEEQRHSLFHPFRSHQGGTGIGMAIVYRVVEAHQGQIKVESTLGEGTVVEICIPH